ncbi:MAG TPA: hypothetical protein EYQ05_03895, partial [Gammaproteobacteria bacterium]|nr:hypothetical protein [Gammaproteobacteria bacterium]
MTCFGETDGAINLTVTGGSSSYTYSWSNGSSVVATTQDLTALAAGTYTVTIVESNSCTITGTVQYVVAAAPAVLASSSTKTNVLCNAASTGAIDLTVTGGTTPYGYSWSNGTSVVSTSADPTGLPAGTYTCTVTDARLCTTTEVVSITQSAVVA